VADSALNAYVADLVVACEKAWPLSGSEEWDNSGLQVGRTSQPLQRVLLTVDVVSQTVEQAIAGKYDAIVSHHPLILRGIPTVAESTYKGRLLGELIRNDVALLAMHTNADVVADGVSDVLAQALGLKSVAPIVPTVSSTIGIGRRGHLASPTTLGSLAQRLAQILPATVPGIQVSGDFSQQIARVALCGGAGDSLLSEAGVRNSDVFITSDLRHHRASEAREEAFLDGGPALINVSHWASEWLWLETAARTLRSALPDVTIDISDVRTDPWDFVITQ
jgi:dinuclear metal center YbgI/SA1388 family protein